MAFFGTPYMRKFTRQTAQIHPQTLAEEAEEFSSVTSADFYLLFCLFVCWVFVRKPPNSLQRGNKVTFGLQTIWFLRT